MLLRSRAGETKTIQQWEKELDEFWEWVTKQNQHIGNRTNKRLFNKPRDAFERYARILGLQPLEDSECAKL